MLLPHVLVIVEAASGAQAGKIVAVIRTDSKGGFKARLSVGRHSIYDRKWPAFPTPVTIGGGRPRRSRCIALLVVSLLALVIAVRPMGVTQTSSGQERLRTLGMRA
jgi:hypothetical protein